MTTAVMPRVEAPVMPPRWLQRPEILPDELAHSYAYRALQLNGASSLDALFSAVFGSSGVAPDFTKAEFLAWIAGIHISEFIRFHTLVPLSQAVAIDESPRRHGHINHDNFRHQALVVKVPFFRWCPHCRGEDHEFWGFPLLRISHHLPGIDWCEKHGEHLVWSDFPTAHISQIQRFSWQAGPPNKKTLTNPSHDIIRRYAAITNGLMTNTHPIPVYVMSRLLVEQSRKRGLRRSHRGNKKLLSDLAMEELPSDWLNNVLPKFFNQKTKPGLFTQSLDGTLNPSATCRPEAYILALALLFSDPDEALSTVSKCRSVALEKRPRKPMTKAPPSSDIARLYTESNFSPSVMASMIHRSPSAVRNLIARYNFPPARLIGHEGNRAALLAFRRGDELDAACRNEGVNSADIIKLFRYDLDQLLAQMRSPVIGNFGILSARG